MGDFSNPPAINAKDFPNAKEKPAIAGFSFAIMNQCHLACVQDAACGEMPGCPAAGLAVERVFKRSWIAGGGKPAPALPDLSGRAPGHPSCPLCTVRCSNLNKLTGNKPDADTSNLHSAGCRRASVPRRR